MQKVYLKTLYIASFFLSIQYAFTAYINSTFLSQFYSDRAVGIIFAVGSFLSILALIEAPRVLARFGNYKIFLWFTLASIILLIGLANAQNEYSAVIFFIAYLVINFLIAFSRDIFLEKYSDIKNMGRIRGFFLTIVNLGWIFAPLASGLLIKNFGLGSTYLASSLLFLPAIAIISHRLHKFKDLKYKRIDIFPAIRKMFQDKDLKFIYLANFILQFFYSWMIIYTPIYLNEHLGFAWDKIGIIFMIMLLPFVLIQYPLGRISDRVGQKKMLLAGFFILIVATGILSFIVSKSILVWGLLLFLTRIGAATVEIMTEVYFFKKVEPTDAETISIYRNTAPVAFILGPLTASAYFFVNSSFQYIFITLAFILILGLFFSAKLNDTVANK